MKETKFITDWRELEIDVPYWMQCRADPDDRDIVVVTSRSEQDPRCYGALLLLGGGLYRFRENTHVFTKIEQAPRLSRELEYFPTD